MMSVTILAEAMKLYGKQQEEKQVRMAIHLDNSQTWLDIDRIATEMNWVIVPIPHFFSISQIQFLIEQASIDCVFCADTAVPFWLSLSFDSVNISEQKTLDLHFLARHVEVQNKIPAGTHKITFTSGTTSEPKGVCLSYEHLSTVGKSLAETIKPLGLTKHISLLPYSILLENMAAFYANEFADLEIVSPPMKDVGMSGSGQLDISTMFTAIKTHQADSMIMMPQMLKQLVQYLQTHPQDVSFLKFIAIGGAVCAAKLIKQARDMGLPVYQGYGISECGSVICLEITQEAAGSVGQSLAHCDVAVASDQEIYVYGPTFLGYLGQQNKAVNSQPFKTGDLGRLDNNGQLYITGRKKNLIINSFGRNILPDWIEGELLALDGVHQAAVYGDGKPFLTGLCVSDLTQYELENKVENLNLNLPDYARIKVVQRVAPFTVANNQLTPSGKIKPQNIFEDYKYLLEKIYASDVKTTKNHAI